MASSSATIPKARRYNVFLSFRGEDTRNGFTSHLRNALSSSDISTFNDYNLRRGDSISPSLLTAIEESMISVIIFSHDYANSGWCLKELIKIFQCKHLNDQIVIPVFYGVDPTHVRKQIGKFGVAFDKLKERLPEGEMDLNKVRSHLEEAANISGWDSHHISPESELIKSIVGDILKKLNQMTLKSPTKKLKEELKKLCARRNDVQKKINRDKTKHANEECVLWMEKAKELEKYVEKLIGRFIDETNKSNMVDVDLNRSLKEKYDEVRSCWAEGSIFVTGEATIEKPPEPIIKMTAPKIDDKPSLQGIVEEVLVNLRDEHVKRIGLWGTVGVGKTAILVNLNNNDQIAEMFEIVIFGTVTGEGDEGKMECPKRKLSLAREKLQHDIAQRLKLDIGNITNMETIALKISEELAGRKCLLILDDVWGIFDLEDIGMRGMEDNSKIVLATRNRYILYDMDVDHDINVKPLSEADAWKLFREKLGQKIDRSFDHEAQVVLRECGRLPLVIKIVAIAFKRYREISLWPARLEKLRKWPNVNFQGMDEVLLKLRFCYDELGDEEIKACFLYSALFGDGCEIWRSFLLECWIAEGLVHGVENLTARGREILHNIISASLLEDGKNLKHVRMNKVLRNMALKISTENKDSKILVRAGEKLREPPSEKDWTEAKWISLMDNELCSLPESPKCNNITTLFLQRNYNLETIPELFFKYMCSVKVLDLHGTKISALPRSLSSLTSVKALYFNSCEQLMELPSTVKAFEHLQVLDIRGTGIDHFSIPTGNLSQLRRLRLSLTKTNGEPMNVDTPEHGISELKLLEELVIDVHPENQLPVEAVRNLAEEVAKLKKLTSLSFCFPNIDTLQHFITHSSTWKEMDSCFAFKFSVAFDQQAQYTAIDFDYDVCRCLKYANGREKHSAMQAVLAETNAFELIGHKGASRLTDFGSQNATKLKSCLINNCNEMKTIIGGNGTTAAVLESLKKMFISNCPELETIWEGCPLPVGTRSLCQLTTLDLSNCAKLKKYFQGHDPATLNSDIWK